MLIPTCGVTGWDSHIDLRRSRYVLLGCDRKGHGFPKWQLLHFGTPHRPQYGPYSSVPGNFSVHSVFIRKTQGSRTRKS